MRHAIYEFKDSASTKTARLINRAIVLKTIRNKQPISRAGVARFSGLQRSTVSRLVEELIALKWIVEGCVDRSSILGRPPIVLNLNRQRAAICVDIQTLEISVGFGNLEGSIVARDRFATPDSLCAALEQIVASINKIRAERSDVDFDGIGVSVPGRIDTVTRRVLFAPVLGWPPFDLQSALEAATGLCARIENEANVCVFGKTWFEKSFENCDLVAITVSQTIGVGMIADGLLIQGHRGVAGEFGHVQIEPRGPTCSCGAKGCWEVMASNSAAAHYYAELNSGAAIPVDFQDLLALARKGDKLADRALARMAFQIARGTRMIVAGLAPEAILFVGDFTSLWNRFRLPIETEVQAQNISTANILLLTERNGTRLRQQGATALVFQGLMD
jgi:predicted NBD/HSP70 family sugar kinase